MECQVNHSWTFSALVGAFLDLAIAYVLLCGSTLAYFASKFLCLFGLSLPCPCNGLFGIPSNGKYCLRRFLVDCPIEKISKVQLSVKSRFPFDSILARDQNSELDMRERYLGVEGESSQMNGMVESGVTNSSHSEEGRLDLKGKGTKNQRLRRRHNGVKLSSGGSSSYINKEIAEESLARFNSSDVEEYNVSIDNDLHERVPSGLGPDKEFAHENNPTNEDLSLVKNSRVSIRGELGFNDSAENTIRFLENALEEEHSTCSALYLDLEKERNAASTAADEAMSMIFRIQEEKAAIEMEARQFQRMIEEKFAYDVEEMDLLKEILIRREREKHFLEKEVESYRQMFIANEHLDDGINNFMNQQNSDTTEDPNLMLQKISESIEAEKKVKNSRSLNYMATFSESQNCTLDLGKELPILSWNEDEDDDLSKHLSCDEEFQEKGVVSMVEKPFVPQRTDDYIDTQINVTHCVNDILKHVKDNTNPQILDVHAIDTGSNFSTDAPENKRKWPSEDATSNGDYSGSSRWGGDLDTRRSLERSRGGLPPISNSRGKSLLSDMRRYSMSAVDYERLKIDTEVEWLREKLRTVQEGREKLNFSVENSERGKIQVQLLEDISNQLQDIRHLSGPGKSARQASLPLPFSKLVSKKRRYRSVSMGVRHST